MLLAHQAASVSDRVAVDGVTARAYTVPTDKPEQDGTFEWDRTTIVIVELEAGGTTGLGYSYASPAAAQVVVEHLAPAIEHVSVLDTSAAARQMSDRLRNAGRPGIGATAIAALDVALHDAKAKLLGVSLLDLLGAARDAIPAYGSGGFTNYSDDELRRQLSGWAHDGLRMVKVKIGRRPDEDHHRVDVARAAVGADVELFVDANGAFDRRGALAAATWLADAGVAWFEEPVTSDDLPGLHALRAAFPAGLELAAGEYCWTPIDAERLLEAGAVDVLQVDATRCLGVTGFRRAAANAHAHHVPLSAHTAPTLHATLCCAAPAARHVEYFHDHVRIEELFFDGAISAENGDLRPDRGRPGLGIELRQPDAEPYLEWRGAWRP
jgi:L-alanine-DL-glutamate epimerase-like enolase superfamily enzyme